MIRAAFAQAFMLSIAAMVVATPAHASVFGNLASDIAMGQMLESNRNAQMGTDDDDGQQSQRQQSRQQQSQGRQSQQQQLQRPQPRPTVAPPQALTFRMSPQRRQANYESYAAQSHPSVAALMRDGGFLESRMPRLTNDFGFRPNNIADSYAMFICFAWQVAVMDDEELTRQQFQAVRAQMGATFLREPGLLTLTDAVKQEMADMNLIQAMMLSEASNMARTMPVERAAMARNWLANMRTLLGVDMRAFVIDDRGFVPR